LHKVEKDFSGKKVYQGKKTAYGAATTESYFVNITEIVTSKANNFNEAAK
jgi:hypothetical protein